MKGGFKILDSNTKHYVKVKTVIINSQQLLLIHHNAVCWNENKKYLYKTISMLLKSGNEELSYENSKIGYKLIDFWKWSVSDILSNATRGKFAEFIVGTAINANFENIRQEWDAYDLESKNGIKIEVKSAAFIQSWLQSKPSNINFSIKPLKNYIDPISKRSADIYVFCLLMHENKETINPLLLEQWEFYVLSTFEINSKLDNQKTISLKTLQKLTNSVLYKDLQNKINDIFSAQTNCKLIK